MFLGEYQYTIDDKGRLTIPAKFRRPLAGGLVVTRGFDRNLAMYPMATWSGLVDKVNQLPYGDLQARRFRRLVFSGASDAELDKQGRINIPTYLLDYGMITKDVIVVGMNNFIELWSPDQWEAECDIMESTENAEHWAHLNI
jgi:MraZ protein